MTSILIYIFIAVVLFASAFIAKRRFGLLGLALAAGSLLSSIWGYDVGLVVSGLGIPSSQLTSVTVSSLIILLPAGALLFHGYTYKNLVGRAIGASMWGSTGPWSGSTGSGSPRPPRPCSNISALQRPA